MKPQRLVAIWLLVTSMLIHHTMAWADPIVPAPSPMRGPVETPAPAVAPKATDWPSPLLEPVRGITIGPIENARHPGRGYGSRHFMRALVDAKHMGATWVALTPFGRVHDLAASGVDLVFEAPLEQNIRDIKRSVAMAHALGLKVLLVPHLWVESGQWRALIEPGSDEGWARWAHSYEAFVMTWARVAQQSNVDLFSVGVEQRSWVTTSRSALYLPIITAVRSVYKGPVTYSANWDDVDDTLILGHLDLIAINAFYPLAENEGASFDALLDGGRRVATKVRSLSAHWQKPVLFAEVGYTTRTNPAVKPWEWPDGMKNVQISETSQAEAYAALLTPMIEEPWFAGFLVWRMYADPDDVSQEAEWGFSPRGKLAELVLRDVFRSRWASDPSSDPGGLLVRWAAQTPGDYGSSALPAWW